MLASVKSTKFRIALIQLAVTESKGRNLLRAVSKIKEAALKGADIVALPECFNSPYGTRYFPEYAEKIPGDSSQALSRAASDNKVFIIGGSIPEEDNGKLYNTCPVFNEAGEMVEKHRKVHLFDINIPEKIQFLESDTLSPGSNLTSFNTSFCKVGIGICYDIRFAEMAQLYARQGCKLLVYPGAFNMVTGPTHWELLQRARAVDNQVYVAAVSPARDVAASYVAWGHSSVVNPWGEVMASAEHEETIVYADLDLNYLSQVRDQVPIIKQRRNELYEVRALSPSS